jgi:hypothetical protein
MDESTQHTCERERSPLSIRVFDAEKKSSAKVAREEVVEKRCTATPDVEVSCQSFVHSWNCCETFHSTLFARHSRDSRQPPALIKSKQEYLCHQKGLHGLTHLSDSARILSPLAASVEFHSSFFEKNSQKCTRGRKKKRKLL